MEQQRICDCELRNRQWNPNTGRCEFCGKRFNDDDAGADLRRRLADAERERDKPVDMVLYCPCCGMQHVDKATPEVCERCGGNEMGNGCQCGKFTPWLNPPHKSHRCHNCNTVFRPADIPTTGVAAIKTKGENDTALEAYQTMRERQ